MSDIKIAKHIVITDSVTIDGFVLPWYVTENITVEDLTGYPEGHEGALSTVTLNVFTDRVTVDTAKVPDSAKIERIPYEEHEPSEDPSNELRIDISGRIAGGQRFELATATQTIEAEVTGDDGHSATVSFNLKQQMVEMLRGLADNVEASLNDEDTTPEPARAPLTDELDRSDSTQG